MLEQTVQSRYQRVVTRSKSLVATYWLWVVLSALLVVLVPICYQYIMGQQYSLSQLVWWTIGLFGVMAVIVLPGFVWDEGPRAYVCISLVPAYLLLVADLAMLGAVLNYLIVGAWNSFLGFAAD